MDIMQFITWLSRFAWIFFCCCTNWNDFFPPPQCVAGMLPQSLTVIRCKCPTSGTVWFPPWHTCKHDAQAGKRGELFHPFYTWNHKIDCMVSFHFILSFISVLWFPIFNWKSKMDAVVHLKGQYKVAYAFSSTMAEVYYFFDCFIANVST